MAVSVMENETESSWANNFFTVANFGECICPGVYGDIAIDSNALLTEYGLIGWGDCAQDVKVFAHGSRVIAESWRAGTPQHRVGVIERYYSGDVMPSHAIDPRLSSCGNFVFC